MAIRNLALAKLTAVKKDKLGDSSARTSLFVLANSWSPFRFSASVISCKVWIALGNFESFTRWVMTFSTRSFPIAEFALVQLAESELCVNYAAAYSDNSWRESRKEKQKEKKGRQKRNKESRCRPRVSVAGDRIPISMKIDRPSLEPFSWRALQSIFQCT